MKKIWSVVCVVLIVLGLAVYAYSELVLLPRQAVNYTISSWRILDLYVTRPLLFAALGCFLILRFMRAQVKLRTAKIVRRVGLVLMVFYLLEIILFLSGGGVSTMSLLLISNLVTSPFQFAIPGILIGIGYSVD